MSASPDTGSAEQTRIPEGCEVSAEEALDRVEAALSLVCVALPHLSGLAHTIRYTADYRICTAGIFASGRLIVNPEWFLGLHRLETVFVVAHELLHLALRSHERDDRTDSKLFNIAHDCVINDMLMEALGPECFDHTVPAGGWHYPDARTMSAEQLMILARSDKICRCSGYAKRCRGSAAPSALTAALERAGITTESDVSPRQAGSDDLDSDVLPEAQERAWYPEAECSGDRLARLAGIRCEIAHAAALQRLRTSMEAPRRGTTPGDLSTTVDALSSLYRPPWEAALQQWMEAVAPGARTYQRANRRGGAERTDVVLPGRRREGWTLNLVLDTSGSMIPAFSPVLGTIAAFCDTLEIAAVRVVQCDVAVTADDRVHPDALRSYPVQGMGGSDLSPALAYLADDPEVEAVIVITDGYIAFPAAAPPFPVLWTLTGTVNVDFRPAYGAVIVADLPVADLLGR